jgi:uridylate kinase
MQRKTTQPIYKRILIKYSGEALMGETGFGIDSSVIQKIAAEILPLVKMQVEIGIVIGGGNFFRGTSFAKCGIDRITSDQMGMVATVINALAIRNVFNQANINTYVMSAFPVPGIVDFYDRVKALEYLQKKYVIIFAGGTGNPLVTTDSALSLRGIELDADILLKATNVDGVYASDPKVDSHAKLYHKLTYQEALTKELAVMDLAAFCQCRDHKMQLRVFNMHKSKALLNIVLGKDEGTLLK